MSWWLLLLLLLWLGLPVVLVMLWSLDLWTAPRRDPFFLVACESCGEWGFYDIEADELICPTCAAAPAGNVYVLPVRRRAS